MNRYAVTITLNISADNENEAKDLAKQVVKNGYAEREDGDRLAFVVFDNTLKVDKLEF